MRDLVLSLSIMTLMSGVALFTPLTNATALAAPSSIGARFGKTSAVENARSCLPKRVCGFRGCHYRKVCRRSQGG
jgi:hypothetical protein